MKPETKQMNKAEFMKLMAENPGAIEMLTDIVQIAKSDGYTTGFDAGYDAASEGNTVYQWE